MKEILHLLFSLTKSYGEDKFYMTCSVYANKLLFTRATNFIGTETIAGAAVYHRTLIRYFAGFVVEPHNVSIIKIVSSTKMLLTQNR